MRRIHAAIILALAAGWVALAAGQTVDPQEERIKRIEAGLLPPVVFGGEPAWSLAERMKLYLVPGLSITVFDGGRIVWSRGYGVADATTGRPVTPETLFQAASISKPVTCFGALRLVQAGLLDLDVPVNRLLKSWQLPENELTRNNPVTLRRIMSHSAGLTVHGFPGYKPGDPLPAIPQILDGQAPANTGAVRVDLAPGTRFRYSGGGTVILGLAMTDTTGLPFAQLMEEKVLKPLGMAHSTFLQPLPPDRLAGAAMAHGSLGLPVEGKYHVYPELPAAGLWTTPADLARFALGVQAALHGRPEALLSQPLAWSMVTQVTPQTGLGFITGRSWWPDTFDHSGGNAGFSCLLIASKTGAHGLVIMTNSDNGGALIPELVRAVAREYGWKDWQAPEFTPAQPGADALSALAGRYRYGIDSPAEIRAGIKELRVLPLEEDPLTLVPLSATEFVARERPVRFRFDGAGNCTVAGEGEPLAVRRMAPEEKLPCELAFENKLDEAAAAYRQLREAGDPAAGEARLNNLGYRLARQDRVKAVAILRVAAMLYPGSANAWDSLAEISLLAADRVLALESYRKVLEVLESDTGASPALKARLRQNAGEQIRKLTGGN